MNYPSLLISTSQMYEILGKILGFLLLLPACPAHSLCTRVGQITSSLKTSTSSLWKSHLNSHPLALFPNVSPCIYSQHSNLLKLYSTQFLSAVLIALILYFKNTSQHPLSPLVNYIFIEHFMCQISKGNFKQPSPLHWFIQQTFIMCLLHSR